MSELPPLSRELRRLRDVAGMSGPETARRTGLSQSKISRVETGKFAPTPETVTALCKAYNATADVRRQLVTQARELSAENMPARTVLQRGSWSMQHRIGRLEAAAEHVTEISPSIVVGLVQTRPYIEALFGDSLPDEERERTVQARLDRQAILDTDRAFTIVHTEGALRWRMGNGQIMADQIDHLIEVSHRPNVAMGVIPWTTPVTVPLLHPVSMYDQRACLIGTHAATAVVTDARLVADYHSHWDEVRPLVSWDEDARNHLRRIAEDYRETT